MNDTASKRVMDLIEGHQSDEEFAAMIARNRLLHICKTKGFPHLHRLGWIKDQPNNDHLIKEKKEQHRNLGFQIAKKLENDQSILQICSDLSITEYKLRRLLGIAKKEHLLPDRRKQKAIFEIEDALELARQGLSTKQIGDHFNCTRQAISEKLRKAGYKYDKKRKDYVKC